jgi:hypothetical protein
MMAAPRLCCHGADRFGNFDHLNVLAARRNAQRPRALRPRTARAQALRIGADRHGSGFKAPQLCSWVGHSVLTQL